MEKERGPKGGNLKQAASGWTDAAGFSTNSFYKLCYEREEPLSQTLNKYIYKFKQLPLQNLIHKRMILS